MLGAPDGRGEGAMFGGNVGVEDPAVGEALGASVRVGILVSR